MRMSEFKGVLVFSENYDLMLEMLGKGRKIADKLQTELAAVLIGHNMQKEANELKYVADKVHVFDGKALRLFQIDACLGILHKLAVNEKPEVMLIGSTRNGKPLAARLATRLETGCTPDCSRLGIDDQRRLVGERITYGGNAVAKIIFRTKPHIVTIPQRAFEKAEPRDKQGQLIFSLEVKTEATKTETVDVKPLETSSVRIEDADVIVSCGRGLEKKEDRALLDELASVLGGVVGNTRPLAEDRKWFTEWVGLSGHKVKPKLYIACGISGVIQHVAGIRDAKVIVAINKDEQAPIFEVADYGVVGNLYEILPALKEALKKQLG